MATRKAKQDLYFPTCDDRLLWDVWMSSYHFPMLCAADELGLFAMLEGGPATAESGIQTATWWSSESPVAIPKSRLPAPGT